MIEPVLTGDGTPILHFRGHYGFMSNFYKEPILIEGVVYPTSEHAYQEAKTEDIDWQFRIRNAESPAEAKRLGKQAPMRPHWDDMKIEVMRHVLYHKFQNPSLRSRLLATGDRLIVEGNRWNDTFWGQCPIGTGENHLGKLLMELRAALREEDALAD